MKKHPVWLCTWLGAKVFKDVDDKFFVQVPDGEEQHGFLTYDDAVAYANSFGADDRRMDYVKIE